MIRAAVLAAFLPSLALASSMGGGSMSFTGAGGGACSMPDVGTPLLDLDARNMNGNGDGNSGWSSAGRVQSSSPWINAGSVSSDFDNANESADSRATWYEQCPGLASAGPCVHFARGHFATSDQAASAWNALHQGDLTCYAVMELDEIQPSGPQTILATGEDADDHGVRLTYVGAGNRVTAEVYNGTGTAYARASARHALVPQKRKVLRWVVSSGAGLLYANAEAKASGTPSGSVSESDATYTLRIGADPNDDGDTLDAYVGRILCYDEAHDTATAEQVECALRSEWTATPTPLSAEGCTIPETEGTADTCCPASGPCRIIAIGDSTTYGYKYAGSAWPYLLQRHLNARHGVGRYVVASIAKGSTESDYHRDTLWASVRGDGYHVLYLMGGTVDTNLGDDGAETLANLTTIAQQASDDGMCAVWMTPLPRGAFADWDATKQGHLETIRDGVLAADIPNVSTVNSYDAMAEPGDGGPSDDLASAYDSGDGLHLNVQGNTCMALIAETGL